MKKRVALAVGFDFAARAAVALVVASPVVAAVTASGIGNFPAGDRLLFAPGGLLLVEVLRASWSLLPPLVTSSFVTIACAFAALTLPESLLWTAVAEETPAATAAFLGTACVRVPALFALRALGFLAQVLALTCGITLASIVHGGGSHNPQHTDLAALGVLAIAFVIALFFGIVRDAAAATLAAGVSSSRQALGIGVSVAARTPRALLARWVGPAVLGVALVSSAALATSALDVGRAEGFRFALVALAHQLVALGLSVCRCVWFQGAVGVVRAQLAGGSAARR